jgi:hypothetical protein
MGDRRRLAAIRRAQFAQDVRHVDARGLDADEQALRDLAVGLAERQPLEDLRSRAVSPSSAAAASASVPSASASALGTAIRARRASASSSARNPSAPSVTATAWAARSGAVACARSRPAIAASA